MTYINHQFSDKSIDSELKDYIYDCPEITTFVTDLIFYFYNENNHGISLYLIDYCLKHGYKMNLGQTDKMYKMNILQLICLLNNNEYTLNLLDRFLNFYSKDIKSIINKQNELTGNTPIHYIFTVNTKREEKSQDIINRSIKLMVKFGANPSIKNNDGVDIYTESETVKNNNIQSDNSLKNSYEKDNIPSFLKSNNKQTSKYYESDSFTISENPTEKSFRSIKSSKLTPLVNSANTDSFTMTSDSSRKDYSSKPSRKSYTDTFTMTQGDDESDIFKAITKSFTSDAEISRPTKRVETDDQMSFNPVEHPTSSIKYGGRMNGGEDDESDDDTKELTSEDINVDDLINNDNEDEEEEDEEENESDEEEEIETETENTEETSEKSESSNVSISNDNVERNNNDFTEVNSDSSVGGYVDSTEKQFDEKFGLDKLNRELSRNNLSKKEKVINTAAEKIQKIMGKDRNTALAYTHVLYHDASLQTDNSDDIVNIVNKNASDPNYVKKKVEEAGADDLKRIESKITMTSNIRNNIPNKKEIYNFGRIFANELDNSPYTSSSDDE